jgi:hypothetical protein
METTLTLLVLTAVVGLSQQQVPRCLLSRLDNVPCRRLNPRIRDASENNQFSMHYTKMEVGGAGGIRCRVKRKNQEIRDITTVGTVNTKVIYSPGFILEKMYDNQLLGQYNIKCDEGRLAFFNVTDINLQGREDCLDTNKKQKCQDYILIDRGMSGTTEICGNSASNDSVLELESGSFTVFFRTSEEKKLGGFEMYIICFRAADRDRRGCLTPMDFNSSVCLAGSGGGDLRPKGITRDEGRGRRRRDTYSDVTYKDIFPEYPSGLRMREDVANFHNLWRRKKRQAGGEFRFISRIVFLNESVNYTDSTIRIADTDGTETGQYEGIRVLQTFNALGEIDAYVTRVSGPRAEVYPHFFGPGPLIIIGAYAYFQLFIIDPRGLIPTPEEEEELRLMNEPLFNSIPDELDFETNDPNQTIDNFSFLGIVRRKRVASGIDYSDEISNERVRRQSSENTEFSNRTLFVALRNREACTPAVRQQALSLIQLFLNTNESMVMALQNFTMGCTVEGKELECTVDDGYAPALDQGTFCTVKGKPPIECDPFYMGFVSFGKIETVTVEATNCNGQRATMTFPLEATG